MFPDYYAILRVRPDASPEEIKQAFRLLARRYHPDVMPNNPAANEQFRNIYEAYQVLSSPELRHEYDYIHTQGQTKGADAHSLPWQPAYAPQDDPQWRDAPMPASYPRLELICTLSQKQALVSSEERLLYLLSELIPVADSPDGKISSTLPLNLCLAIDRSSSMRGEKLHAVKTALRSLIQHLQPEDILSIVAFDNRAEVIVRAEAKQIADVMISTVDQLIERGGTEIGWGLATALDEVQRFCKQPMVSHIILLTDGETYGDEQRCLELAQRAHEQGIAITALGIGTEWNEQLLDQIATISEGTADYLATADQISATLNQRVTALRSTLATNVKLSLRLEGGVRLRRVTRVFPDISELMDAVPTDQRWMLAREAQLDVGNVTASAQNCALALLCEIVLPVNVSGHYILGQMDVQYDIPCVKLLAQHQSANIAIDFVEFISPASLSVPLKIKQVIEYVTAYRLQNKARERIDQGDHAGAGLLMHTAALRLRGAAQDDLAQEAQAQAQQLMQQQVPARASALKLKYATKNLHAPKR